MKRKQKKQALVFLSVLTLLVFNYPILSIFNRPDWVSDFPLFLLFLFAAWFGLILVTLGLVQLFKNEKQ